MNRRIINTVFSILMRTNAYGESPEDESAIARFILKHALLLGFLLGLLTAFFLRSFDGQWPYFPG